MRLISAFLSVLAVAGYVSADGSGNYVNSQAQQQAETSRENTITWSSRQGILLDSQSLTFNPASNTTIANVNYDEVDISAEVYDNYYGGKFEIQINNFNLTENVGVRHPNVQIQLFAFAWRPYSVVQYVENSKDATGNVVQNGFDANDTLCSEYQIRTQLQNQNRFAFTYLGSNVTTAVNNASQTVYVQSFSAASSDGVFTLIIKASGAVGTNTQTGAHGHAVEIDGRFISPTSIKFDILINTTAPALKLNSLNANCSSKNWQIALKSWARSMEDIFAKTTTDATVNGTTTKTTTVTNLVRIQTGGFSEPFGFLTWATSAAATSNSTGALTPTSTNVIATTLVPQVNNEDDDNLDVTKLAIHSFDVIKPTFINWDPEFGSDSTSPDTPVTGTSGATTTGASFLTLIIASIVALFAQ
jgi:hypothetical protein